MSKVADNAINDVIGRDADTIHHCLRSSRRRLIVMLLACRIFAIHQIPDNEGIRNDLQMSSRELARHIVAMEQDIDEAYATGAEYHNVYTALAQTHLPLLDDVAAIEYDPDRKVVRPAENLLPMAIITAVTSGVSQVIFHAAAAQLIFPGKPNQEGAISD